MYTCRLIADEMKGIALGTNIVTFGTLFSKSTRITAGDWERTLAAIACRKTDLLDIEEITVSQLVVKELAKRFPCYIPVVQRFGCPNTPHCLPDRTWGEVPSITRDFVDAALDLIVSEGQNLHITSKFRNLPCQFEPWIIPKGADIKLVWESEGYDVIEARLWDLFKHRFSAAAVAIQYLYSLPKHRRLQLKDVVVHEDRKAVGFAECHGRGLIPFCLENPHLRIQRRVDLWRNAFRRDDDRQVLSHLRWKTPMRQGLLPWHATRGVALWIMEASILHSFGMSTQSFSMVLDGNPITQETSEVFDMMHQYIAHESAMTTVLDSECHPLDDRFCFRKHDLLPDIKALFDKEGFVGDPEWWFERRNMPCYLFEGFCKEWHSIINGTSSIATSVSERRGMLSACWRSAGNGL